MDGSQHVKDGQHAKDGQRATRWIDVGFITDIPRLGARVVRTPRGDIAVFRAGDDTIFALDDLCPHKRGPLSQGIVHGYSVTCPLHGWNIDLASGAAQAPDRGCTRTIPLRQEGERILIALSNDASPTDAAADAAA